MRSRSTVMEPSLLNPVLECAPPPSTLPNPEVLSAQDPEYMEHRRRLQLRAGLHAMFSAPKPGSTALSEPYEDMKAEMMLVFFVSCTLRFNYHPLSLWSSRSFSIILPALTTPMIVSPDHDTSLSPSSTSEFVSREGFCFSDSEVRVQTNRQA